MLIDGVARSQAVRELSNIFLKWNLCKPTAHISVALAEQHQNDCQRIFGAFSFRLSRFYSLIVRTLIRSSMGEVHGLFVSAFK